QPTARLELRKALAQTRQRSDERGHILVAAELRPVHPADFIVLTISVVVAALTVRDLVPGEQQRHTLCKEETGELIAPQQPAHCDDVRIVGRTLDATVRADVVIRTVAIVLAVRLVVFALIGEEIGEGKPVVDGHVIDARARASAAVLELQRRAGHGMRHVADQIAFAAPEPAGSLAVDVVPFRPAGREAADLIAAEPDVPRLGDQLDVGEHRILQDCRKKRSVAIEAGLPAERRGKVEAESVHVEGFRFDLASTLGREPGFDRNGPSVEARSKRNPSTWKDSASTLPR